MKPLVDGILALVVLTNFVLLGSTRIRGYIPVLAFQGMLLALLALLMNIRSLGTHVLLVAIGSAALKGFVFPWLLRRAIREADVHAHVGPFVGYHASVLLGAIGLPLCMQLAKQLPAQVPIVASSALPVAIYTMFVGLFLIVARRKAITQVIGYLVLENGIYIEALSLAGEMPWIVELGVLLDVFVAVFVMGIAIYRINREFDHMFADQLSTLKG